MENVLKDELNRKVQLITELAEAEKAPVKEVKCKPGPSVSLFNVYPQEGVKPKRWSSFQEALEFHASWWCSRPVRVTKGMGFLEVEIPNENQAIESLLPLLETPEFSEGEAELPLALGIGMGMKPRVLDLAQAHHILIGGATKQGKSECLHSMIASLRASKGTESLKFTLIDPKGTEFQEYERLGYASQVVTNLPDATEALDVLCGEMESRLAAVAEQGTKNIRECRTATGEPFPYIVCMIDEYADLVLMKDYDSPSRKQVARLTEAIFKLTLKGHLSGIHIILATQRPAPDIITNLIKTQFPTRIAFRTSSRSDSERILGIPGAEKLLGAGDMFLSTGAGCERIQGAYATSGFQHTQDKDQLT
jgi:S-DNA-T family DNA segregation ATPase FtsK/SpoIIIE